jgi:enoyl-CoA hydratase
MTPATTYENILVETRGNVGLITLNRPKALNALNRQLLDELSQVIHEIAADESARVVVITGAGDRAFAAGADITEIAALGPSDARAFASFGQSVFARLETLGKPVIAAVNGFALGGGCELAMACTIRLAVETAKFGQPEVTIGIIPGYGGTQRLPRLVGKGRALQLILSADMIDAQEAYRIGLVNEIVAKDNLIPRAEAILNKINANAPTAVKLAIEAANRGLDVSLAEGLNIEASLFTQCFATEDRKEGVAAFREKRKPNFKGQ